MDSIFMFSKSYWLYFSFILNTKLIIQFSICDMEIPAIHNSEAESKPIEHEEESKFALFQSVISKYFEIIRSIMPKITSLSMQNEEFEKSIFTLENKMSKIEKDQENLHFEVRANFITIDTKLNSILADHSNIVLENAKFRKQAEDLSRQLKEVKYYRGTELVQAPPASQSQEKKLSTENRLINNSSFSKGKGKRIAFLDEKLNKTTQQPNEQPNQKRVSIFQKGGRSVSIDQEQSLSSKLDKLESNISSKNEVFNSEKMLELTENKISKSMKSERVLARKATQKSSMKPSPTKKKATNMSKSHKVILSSHKDECQAEKLEEVLREMENFHRNNQIMKNNYEQLMGEYCKINQEQFGRLEGELTSIKKKLQELDYYHVHMEKIKLTLQNKIQQNFKDLQTKLEGKVSKSDLNELVADINDRISAFHEERKRVANKEETKKALQFLENKLNYLFENLEGNQSAVKLHYVNLQAATLRTRGSQLNQRPVTNHEGRPNKNSLSKSSKQLVSQHERQPSQEGQLMNQTQRHGESLHSRFKNERRFNESLNDFRMYTGQKNADEVKTLRKQTPPKQMTNLNLLREKSKVMLGSQKPKTRNKLKREPLIFQYDN